MFFVPVLVSALFLSAMGVHGSSQCAIWQKGPPQVTSMSTRAQNIAGSPGSSVGACGISYAEGTHFVMLWTGSNSNVKAPAGATPGWVTGASKQNCGKQVTVTNPANGKTVTGPVVESGKFSQQNIDVKTGCSSISISTKMVTELGGQPGVPLQVTWRFATTPF